MNINYFALYFDIHKSTACRIISLFGQTMSAWDRLRSDRLKKKLTQLEERFGYIVYHIRAVAISSSKAAC